MPPFGEKIVKIGPVDTEIALLRVKRRKLENAWQSLVYSPLGAVVLLPSEYLWKTLTYWPPECLTANIGELSVLKILDSSRTTSFA